MGAGVAGGGAIVPPGGDVARVVGGGAGAVVRLPVEVADPVADGPGSVDWSPAVEGASDVCSAVVVALVGTDVVKVTVPVDPTGTVVSTDTVVPVVVVRFAAPWTALVSSPASRNVFVIRTTA